MSEVTVINALSSGFPRQCAADKLGQFNREPFLVRTNSDASASVSFRGLWILLGQRVKSAYDAGSHEMIRGLCAMLKVQPHFDPVSCQIAEHVAKSASVCGVANLTRTNAAERPSWCGQEGLAVELTEAWSAAHLTRGSPELNAFDYRDFRHAL